EITKKVMVVVIACILWGPVYTISDVPFWTMTSVMTDEPQEREKAAAYAMLGVNAGIGATLVVFPKLSDYFADGSADQGYLPAVNVVLIAGLFFMLNGFYNTTERISTNRCEQDTLQQPFQAVLKNTPL
ncbi:sodium:galactoside symporter, partial [Vibrio parahaemolyticus]|uniref:MFS transporter n=1 Tax=Vibrio parahaemolyticus TaxID=670 RepID=UPI00062B1CDB